LLKIRRGCCIRFLLLSARRLSDGCSTVLLKSLLPRFQRASPSTSLDKKFNYVIHCILYLFSKKVNIFLKYSDNNALYSIQKRGPLYVEGPFFFICLFPLYRIFSYYFFYTFLYLFFI